MKNVFAKLPRHWHDLIINPPCRTAPPINFPKKNCAPFVIKDLENGILILIGGHYALAPLENDVGVYSPFIFARKGRLNLLTYSIWQKRFYNRIGQWNVVN